LCAGAPEQFPTTTVAQQLPETGTKNVGANTAAQAGQIVGPLSGDYSCTVSDKLNSLLEHQIRERDERGRPIA
jgi:hypothetical protein